MTLIRWEPRRDMISAQRKARRIFEEFEGALQNGLHFEMGSYLPRVDISEDEKTFFVHAELPGLKPEEVKVTVSDGVLTIRGEKKRTEEHTERNFHRIERNFGEFVRQFTLPENLSEEANATFRDGILEIAIPKVEPEKPAEREIPIRSANPMETSKSSVH